MANIMKELKAEISRLARKEINKELTLVKRVNATQRGLIADLRRQLTALQKQVQSVSRQAPSSTTETPVEQAPVSGKRGRASGSGKDGRKGSWFTGKGIQSVRTRLGLTQPQLAKLAGVSNWTVVNWERSKGKISLRRKNTAARLQEIRKMGKREAVRALNGN